ncbi:prepilin peptidase [bacterium]|nr:prepilin peptidase [bacterium]
MPVQTAAPTLTEVLMAPHMYVFLCVIAFGFGTIFGSFLNVAIYRVPLGVSVNDPKRSFCFRCGTPIRWYDNIPILSYFLLRGRCHACGAKFSIRYAMVEFLTGVIFVAIFMAHNTPETGFSASTIWYIAFACILIVGTFTDLDHWIVPDGLTKYGTVVALVAALVIGIWDPVGILTESGPFPAIRLAGGDWFDKLGAIVRGPTKMGWGADQIYFWEPFANAAMGAIFGPFLLYGIGVLGKMAFGKEGMGFGDVKLFAAIGATVGPINVILVLVLSAFIGSIIGLSTIAFGKRTRPEDSPLALGAAKLEPEGPKIPELTEDERGQNSAIAADLEMEFVDLTETAIPPAAIEQFPANLVNENVVFPLEIGEERVRLAVADPMNTRLIAALREHFQRDVEFAIAAESQIRALAAHVWGDANSAEGKAEQPLFDNYMEVATLAPLPRQLHHLPFVPSIAAACLLMLIFHSQIHLGVEKLFFPF